MFVYGLIDPRTSALRYVGKSYSPTKRLRDHITLARCLLRDRRHVMQWIRGLLQVQMSPLLQILEEVPSDIVDDVERFWIASLRAAGAKLLNIADGGEGGSRSISETTRQKIRAAHLGKKLSADHLAKFLAGRRPITAAGRAKISRAMKGRSFSDETRAKISAAGRQRTSPRFRALNEKRRGQKLTAEHRGKIRASLARRFEDQTTCCHGHLYTEENTYRKKNGTKSCRECCRIKDRRRKARC